MSGLICAICPTYNRPELLGRAIRAFEKQTYENRYLIIVDDAGQYENQKGDRWELISIPRRVLTLGEKNNVCAHLAPFNTWAYAKWDDDDIYMPWHLESLAEALHRGSFVQPRYAIDFWDGEWVQIETYNRKKPKHFCYHGCWGYTRELFNKVGGYRARYAGDDGEFQSRLVQDFKIQSVGTDSQYKPSYWYNRPLQDRISERGDNLEAYLNKEVEVPFCGKVPLWTDETVWERETPTKQIRRPW